jgi:replicative superfamily II helicase
MLNIASKKIISELEQIRIREKMDSELEEGLLVKKQVLKEFKEVPGIGNSIAEDLWNMGYRSLSDLRNKTGEELYEELEKTQGCTDRCMLYVFRGAVYYASTPDDQREFRQWWEFKD